MPIKNSLADIALKTMNVVHNCVVKVSGGRLGYNLMGMQAVSLETTGRKSGLKRHTMLTAPIHDELRTILVASKGGDDRDPEWYLNLVANPEVTLKFGDKVVAMKARTASVDEKAELWPTIIKAYKGYAGYQKRSKRDIPVVICEPT